MMTNDEFRTGDGGLPSHVRPTSEVDEGDDLRRRDEQKDGKRNDDAHDSGFGFCPNR